jgi:hypothetical protein
MVFSFLAIAHAFWRREPRDDVQWKAFVGTFAGVGTGLLVWIFGLISGLY